ncbi:outer membrane receptor protein involved in Fe transport [Brevundimonas alba]|uniref:Outer membrane receptor protein involved in Fe transport n=2 Tax=Brevundimonas alba TaxID=74314 RepID=A0A7X6BPE9_9CAUL|nr:outer membrane receptor protein involved in Fe transport [Brevundimonas alba]
MRQSIRQRLLVGTIISGSVLAIAGAASAQTAAVAGTAPQAPLDQEAAQIEEVIVTGSRIRRDPTNAPTPLIQVNREQLLTTGQTSVINYLATLPVLSNSTIPSDTTGNLNTGGLSLPNLRALGSNRTLTLVDGRRHVGAAQGSLAVDIDAIPRLLIENIEIITGGASSVYGADAVSGVLNFLLRKDFDGLEVDANWGMVNQDGQANRRVSVLGGVNLLDDRLNIYAHGEYDRTDGVNVADIDWLMEGRVFGAAGTAVDADPTSARNDGEIDVVPFSHVRRLDRMPWGQTTLANAQRPSALNDPDVPLTNCTTVTSANCYSVDPTRTFVYDGPTARLANFGERIGNVGANRGHNIGGDGIPVHQFAGLSRTPATESQRFQVGANFAVSDTVKLTAEYKTITEDNFLASQPTFFDAFLNNDSRGAGEVNQLRSQTQFDLRLDNAFLPANVLAAINANMVTNYNNPTATTPGTPQTPVSRQWARHAAFGPDRTQTNQREIERFVIALEGSMSRLGFVDNVNWDLSYVYGEARNVNVERGVDSQRWALAADAVRDNAGVLGTPGAIVCRSRLIAASNPGRTAADGTGGLRDDFRIGRAGTVGDDLRDTVEGQRALSQCTPLNIFGAGNQSQAALDYIDAAITVSHTNEQEQLLGAVSGQLWDFWGAGEIGIALGAEHRREYAQGIGRSATTGDRWLLLNTGADFAGAEYQSDEIFGELSLPLFRDSWLGDYAELSGSYRFADYTTVGKTEVYGVNLVYRPIADIAFKTSFNSSIRVPDLSENFAPLTQTFFNMPVDPCATTNINAPFSANYTAEKRSNRIANCTALAAAQGRSFDFAGATATNTDDFNPNYGSGVGGVAGGNPFLKPEQSDSFTFSTVLEPRFIPNLTLVLDYYEIEITDAIASITAQQAANNCVDGSSLNSAACATIFRRDPTPGREFYIGAPAGDPFGGFIQGSVNFAAFTTRGLDFTARYSLDLEETTGHDWGRLNYSIGGLWLLEQEFFTNSADPTDGTEFASTAVIGGGLPRVRFSSSLTWTPTDTLNLNWTADWQSAQDIVSPRDFINDVDARPADSLNTGNFTRHDFTVKWQARDDVSVRVGVVNAFDAEQSRYLAGALYSNFDPYGRRFFIGLNYRPN